MVATSEALRLANEVGLDLVEVNPSVRPPIAKILDFGQFQYKQQKIIQAQRSKAKKVEIKGIRLSLNIGEHDKQTRLKQAMKFLDEGHKVRLEVVLRGRERAHADQARQVMERFANDLGTSVEVPFARQGGRLSLQVARSKKAPPQKPVSNQEQPSVS